MSDDLVRYETIAIVSMNRKLNAVNDALKALLRGAWRGPLQCLTAENEDADGRCPL